MILCLTGIYLVLTWVFASWTRPIVVMSVIPFGLVGTIYGHYIWDVPLSLFTVVGLLGMTGIIINDSIVLITSIDEYAKERGLIPSVIEGAVDRLRPVMLTTLTTVLGLAPLLYERSSQAQFLKPTVITLVYGLGFGMLLVLLVVPALIAVQHDVRRNFVSLRHALFGRARGVRLAIWSVALVIGGWFGATMGWMMNFGALPNAIASGLPFPAASGSMPIAFAVFFAGACAIVCFAFFASLIVQGMGRLRT